MPNPELHGPIPIVWDIEADRIYTGQPGERHADISAKFAPGGIVEGVFDPKGNLQIRSDTDMPWSVYHLTRLWYSIHPELEIKHVYRLVGEDRVKLATSRSIAASCIRAFSADPLWEAAQRLKHLGSVYIAGESVKRIAQRQDMGPDEFQIVVQGVEPDELREIVSQYAGVGALVRVAMIGFETVERHLASVKAANLHVAAETPAAILRRMEELERAGKVRPDRSRVVHRFPDGWTINHLPYIGDVHREGVSAGHCWAEGYQFGFDDPDTPDSELDYEMPNSDYHSLRDPQGIPRVSFHADRTHIMNPFGRHNAPPKPEYMERLRQWKPDAKFEIDGNGGPEWDALYDRYVMSSVPVMVSLATGELIDPYHETERWIAEAPVTLESILDPEWTAEDAFERTGNILDPVHPALSDKVFDNPADPEPTVKPDIVKFVRSTIVDAMREAGWPDPEEHGYLSLVLTGSLTTFQYDDEGGSDFDVSLFIDAKRMPDWVRADLIKVMVENVDGTNLPDTQIPLQAYVVPADISREDLYKPGHRAGYDLDTGEWIVPPDPSMAKEVSQTQKLYAQSVVDKMKLLLLFAPDGAKQYWHEIHEKRRNSMREGGNDHADSNVAYKALANAGLFEPISKLTGEYIASVKTSMGFNGGLPELTFEVSSPEFSHIWGTATSTYEAFSGNEFVGSLQIDADEDKIIEVEVEPEWRRRGVATALLNRARQDYPRLRHSDELTDDGEAWSKRVGSIPTAATPTPQVSFGMKTASMLKEADWRQVQSKAVRLLRDGKVTVMANMPTYILGHVIGDHGEYEVEISRTMADSSTIEQWRCGCKWSQYSWNRTRKWKKYEGRVCSHVLALYWAAKSHPLDVSGEEEGYQAPRGQRVRPHSEEEAAAYNQRRDQLTEQQADLGLDLDKLPRTFGPDGEPIEEQAPPIVDLPDRRKQIDQMMNLRAPGKVPGPAGPIAPQPQNPFAVPRPNALPKPDRLQLFDITAPPGGQPVPPQNPTSIPGANPPGWQNPGNPTQFPGTFSKVRVAMADRSGVPEVDQLIEDFLKEPVEAYGGDTPETILNMRDPQNAHGMCQVVTEQFVEFAKARGFKAYTTHTDLDEMGYKPSIEPFGEIGFDENDQMQHGFYNEHTVATIVINDPAHPYGREIYIDFTATQYGYTDHPKVSNVQPGTRVLIDVQLEHTGDPSHWVPATVVEHRPDTEGEMWDEDEYDVEFDEVPEDLKEHIKVDGKTYKRMPESWIHREDERNA